MVCLLRNLDNDLYDVKISVNEEEYLCAVCKDFYRLNKCRCRYYCNNYVAAPQNFRTTM